uniref:Uncharacterized protein n=1 Tax=Oryza punctata TaxID=4537 RepID=A0A0E0MHU9_ORYPU
MEEPARDHSMPSGSQRRPIPPPPGASQEEVDSYSHDVSRWTHPPGPNPHERFLSYPYYLRIESTGEGEPGQEIVEEEASSSSSHGGASRFSLPLGRQPPPVEPGPNVTLNPDLHFDPYPYVVPRSIFFVMELAVYIVLMVSLFIVSTQSW